jgi:hypothetical protein
MNDSSQAGAHAILGQKYAYATVSLILGIASFINLLGFDKAILAIIFASLALRREPAPVLKDRRLWGKAGLVLGVLQVVLVSVLLIVFRDELNELIEMFMKLQDAK